MSGNIRTSNPKDLEVIFVTRICGVFFWRIFISKPAFAALVDKLSKSCFFVQPVRFFVLSVSERAASQHHSAAKLTLDCVNVVQASQELTKFIHIHLQNTAGKSAGTQASTLRPDIYRFFFLKRLCH